MIHGLRTIRRLADPGEATESRVVEGVVVEKGIPPRKRHNGLLRVLDALVVGESFLWHCQPSFHRAKFLPRKFITHGEGPKKFRIWRVL